MTKHDLKFTTTRQRELMRVVLQCFADYDKREQPYYRLEGMATDSVVKHAIGDFTTLRAFWPKNLVSHDQRYGNIYQLEDDTIHKAQNSVRSTLEQLEDRGYIEKLGNENERRWRPIKALRGVTL